MKKLFLFAIAPFYLAITSCSSPDTSVRLRGHNLQGYDGKVIIYDDCLKRDCSFRFGTTSVSIQKDGGFDTIISVTKPMYCTVDACNAFLIPGENLDITYSSTSNEYSFTGATAMECDFLNKNPLNIYGDLSFLYGGKYALGTFAETKRAVDSLAAIRMHLLETSKGLDPFFVEIEKARTQAHVVNSYLNYFMFTQGYVACDMGNEGSTPQGKEYIESIREYVEPLVKSFLDDRFSLNADIRWAVERCKNGGLLTIPEGSVWEQLYAARELMRKFEDENGGLGEVVAQAKLLLPKISDADLAGMLKNEIEQKDMLASGKVACEFNLEDIDGNRVNMSAFKGKPIYIDLWATWCGICIVEAPSFVKLKEQYPDIIFLSISIDAKKDIWKKFLAAKPKADVPQFIAVNKDSLMKSWNVFGVPRCILIDKDYRIVDAYAPRPNTEEIKTLLDGLLK